MKSFFVLTFKMNTMKLTIFVISVFLSLFISGCKYDFIIPVEVPVIDTGGKPISFATQIAPIFSNGDNCTSCHKSGGQAPDLSATNAYSQIMSKYVNTATPDQSRIYSFPAPTSSTHTWKKYTAGDAAILLAWIKEGAKNN